MVFKSMCMSYKLGDEAIPFSIVFTGNPHVASVSPLSSLNEVRQPYLTGVKFQEGIACLPPVTKKGSNWDPLMLRRHWAGRYESPVAVPVVEWL